MFTNAAGTAPVIACDLTAIKDPSRYEVLKGSLRAAISGRAELPDGFAFSLDGNKISLVQLGEWMSYERQCCPFLNFDLSVSGTDHVWWLTMTGPEEAKLILDREFPE